MQVDGERLTQSFILSPEVLDSAWPPDSVEELRPEHCEPILALSPEIVIVGTASSSHFMLQWQRIVTASLARQNILGGLIHRLQIRDLPTYRSHIILRG